MTTADAERPISSGDTCSVAELLIARNPDPDSRLPYLLRLPLDEGLVFRTSGTWPRTKALFCYPLTVEDWPVEADIVERVTVRSCVRRGAAIDLVLDRGRENRSQIVFTQARGRPAVFWQTARVRKQARPNVTTPTARAAGIVELEITVDTRERYPYTFPTQQATTTRKALPCGDYGTYLDGLLVAAVERKSLVDLVSSLTGGKLRYQLGELATLPRAAVVVEDRYSQLFKLDHIRPALIADGIAELAVRWPEIPILWCETRQLAQEWTYRYLAAVHTWATTESALHTPTETRSVAAPATPAVTAQPREAATSEVRAWARSAGLDVSARGRLRPEIWQAWHDTAPH